MKQILQNNKGLVQEVFDKVSNKYDLMNDFMSLGFTGFGRRDLINMYVTIQKYKVNRC